MGMSSHPDWEWVEVGHSYTPTQADLADQYNYSDIYGPGDHNPYGPGDHNPYGPGDHNPYGPGDDFSHYPGTYGSAPVTGLGVEEPSYLQFDPFQATHVIGTPGSDMQYWHQQADADSCAVVAQESVLESVTGQQFSEGTLQNEAMAHGWYTPGGGTSLNDIGNLLEAHGVAVQLVDDRGVSQPAEVVALG